MPTPPPPAPVLGAKFHETYVVNASETELLVPQTISDTFAHGTDVNVSVMAIAHSGLKSGTLSLTMLVDLTPPTVGTVEVEWAKSAQSRPELSTYHCMPETMVHLQLRWSGFTDPESGVVRYRVHYNSSMSGLNPSSANLSWPREAGEAQVLVVPAPNATDGLATYHVEACNGVDLCSFSPASTPVHVEVSGPTAGVARLQQSPYENPAWGVSSHAPSTGFGNRNVFPMNASWSGFGTPTGGSLAYELCVGTSPHACQFYGPQPAAATPSDPSAGAFEWFSENNKSTAWPGVWPLRCSHTYFLSVRATDCAGLSSRALAPPLKVCCDPPKVKGVTLVRAGYNASLASAVDAAGVPFAVPSDALELTWTSMSEPCSGIRHVAAELVASSNGVAAYGASWRVELSVGTNASAHAGLLNRFKSVPSAALAALTSGYKYRVRLTAVSHAGWQTEALSAEFIYDATPPSTGTLVEGGARGASSCFTPSAGRPITVGWEGFVDSDSQLQAIEIGLGSSPFASDLVPLTLVGQTSSGMAVLPSTAGTSGLAEGSKMYATLRATNGAGLSVVASASKGFLALDAASEPTICM